MRQGIASSIPSKGNFQRAQPFGLPHGSAGHSGWARPMARRLGELTTGRARTPTSRTPGACWRGVLAESLFDPDYRLGSSLDEWAIAKGMVQNATKKMARSPLWYPTLAEVTFCLKRHEPLVVEIAQKLMRKGAVQGPELRSLLEPIVGLVKQAPPHQKPITPSRAGGLEGNRQRRL